MPKVITVVLFVSLTTSQSLASDACPNLLRAPLDSLILGTVAEALQVPEHPLRERLERAASMIDDSSVVAVPIKFSVSGEGRYLENRNESTLGKNLLGIDDENRAFVVAVEAVHEYGHHIFQTLLQRDAPDLWQEYLRTIATFNQRFRLKLDGKTIALLETKYEIVNTMQEPFADLLACATMDNPDAVKLALDIISPADYMKRTNALRSNVLPMQLSAKSEEGYMMDSHHVLRQGRQMMWRLFLANG